MTGLDAWRRLLWYLWVSARNVPEDREAHGCKFFLPGFHPWNEDDRNLLRAYEASAAGGQRRLRR